MPCWASAASRGSGAPGRGGPHNPAFAPRLKSSIVFEQRPHQRLESVDLLVDEGCVAFDLLYDVKGRGPSGNL